MHFKLWLKLFKNYLNLVQEVRKSKNVIPCLRWTSYLIKRESLIKRSRTNRINHNLLVENLQPIFLHLGIPMSLQYGSQNNIYSNDPKTQLNSFKPPHLAHSELATPPTLSLNLSLLSLNQGLSPCGSLFLCGTVVVWGVSLCRDGGRGRRGGFSHKMDARGDKASIHRPRNEKHFPEENREATSSRGNAEGPWG